MNKITVICLGRLKEKYLSAACDEYTKRLSRYCFLTVDEIQPQALNENPSPLQIEKALDSEAQVIKKRIPKNVYTVALCIEGKKLSSESLAGLVKENCDGGRPICFIIGSSYGLSKEIKSQADLRLSVSDMTFPHQLFRIMLLEQIYRSFKIIEGSEYHK